MMREFFFVQQNDIRFAWMTRRLTENRSMISLNGGLPGCNDKCG